MPAPYVVSFIASRDTDEEAIKYVDMQDRGNLQVGLSMVATEPHANSIGLACM